MIIVSAANDKYVTHLGVMINSLLINLKNCYGVSFYIIDSDISKRNKELLVNLVRKYDGVIEFVHFEDSVLQEFMMNQEISYITKETYYRLFIPSILGLDISKALYLDCDILVLKDIRLLWDTDISKYAIGAVEDAYKERNGELEIPHNYGYFNAGLLLMNLEKWRNEEITSKLIRYIQENPTKLKLMDQDALNAVLYKDRYILNLEWNYATDFWIDCPIEAPAVIHFTGPKKPWNSIVKYKDEYYKYLESTAFNMLMVDKPHV